MPDHTAATIQLDEQYPEHVKLRAVADKSNTIGEFVDEFLTTKRIYLTDSHDREISTNQLRSLLAEFFGIDERKLEDEKQAMLESLR